MQQYTHIIAILGIASCAFGADHDVPGDYLTIQDAIDAADNLDRIFVAPGTWTGTGTSVIDFRGKQLSVQATGSVSETILDGGDVRQCVLLVSGENASTYLQGFTITRGYGENGGGILIQDSSPTILDCMIRSNVADTHGGGIAVFGGAASIRDCVVHGNSADDWGGGLFLSGGSTLIENTTISSNTAVNGAGAFSLETVELIWKSCSFVSNNASKSKGLGGGVFHLNHSNPEAECNFEDCTITNNTAVFGGGVGMEIGTLNFRNCEISNNTATTDGGGFALSISAASAWNTVICGNTPNQFSYGSGSFTFHTFDFIGPDCPSSQGACCSLGCAMTTMSDCADLGGVWLGAGGLCDDCPAACSADTNSDGTVNIDDLLNLMSAWGPCP